MFKDRPKSCFGIQKQFEKKENRSDEITQKFSEKI